MLTITNAAKSYLHNRAANHGESYIWLGVNSGGCNGFQYEWKFVKEPGPDASTIDLGSTVGPNGQGGVGPRDIKLVVDKISEMYLLGSEVDYVDDLGASFLKITNPTATSSCGCGESFGV
jgi:iron-sulfur cluster insertion protein